MSPTRMKGVFGQLGKQEEGKNSACHRFSFHPEVEEFEDFLDQLGRFRPGTLEPIDFHIGLCPDHVTCVN